MIGLKFGVGGRLTEFTSIPGFEGSQPIVWWNSSVSRKMPTFETMYAAGTLAEMKTHMHA